MNIRSRLAVFWPVLLSVILSLVSCNNNDESGVLFDSEVNTTEQYFFYKSGDSIYAVDSESPLSSILVVEKAIAPTLIRHELSLHDALDTKISIYPALVYFKNGRIWGVNAVKGKNLRQAPISNETNANTICYLRDYPNDDLLATQFWYTLAGADGVCGYPFFESDDIEKYVTLGMSKTDKPIPVTIVYQTGTGNSRVFAYFSEPIPGKDYATPIGQLYMENDQLVWYDGWGRDPQTRMVVASGLTKIQVMTFSIGNTLFLNLDNQLKLFSPYTKSLSPTLFTFQSDSPRVVFDITDYTNVTIVDSTGIYRMLASGEQAPVSIYVPDTQVLSLYYINATANYIEFSAFTSSTVTSMSVSKDGSELIEWYSQPLSSTVYSYDLIDDVYVYSDRDTNTVTFVRGDGQLHKTVDNSFVIDEIYRTKYTKGESGYDIDRLLIGTFAANGIVVLSVYDKNGNKVTQLGEFKSSQLASFSGDSVVSDDKMIITLPGKLSDEVFYADLNRNGSLVQVTENSIDEQVQWYFQIY